MGLVGSTWRWKDDFQKLLPIGLITLANVIYRSSHLLPNSINYICPPSGFQLLKVAVKFLSLSEDNMAVCFFAIFRHMLETDLVNVV